MLLRERHTEGQKGRRPNGLGTEKSQGKEIRSIRLGEVTGLFKVTVMQHEIVDPGLLGSWAQPLTSCRGVPVSLGFPLRTRGSCKAGLVSPEDAGAWHRPGGAGGRWLKGPASIFSSKHWVSGTQSGTESIFFLKQALP